MIDVNVSLHRWPFRRLAGDAPMELVSRLRKGGITQAWAGSFDARLHRDMAAVNARIAAECKTYGKDFLVPFGCVNPRLPDWQEDLRVRSHGEGFVTVLETMLSEPGLFLMDEPEAALSFTSTLRLLAIIDGARRIGRLQFGVLVDKASGRAHLVDCGSARRACSTANARRRKSGRGRSRRGR